ncbi:MAG: methyltransferase domain-containing protein [Cyanobacteria bacterium REEB67]|nr:methyltransferase domain-containing protein [Cyanobacteria bacterium REEB67]
MTFDWNEVWDRHGQSESLDHMEVSGFQSFRDVDTENCAGKLIELCKIKPQDTVLELGCGAGLLGRHLDKYCHYIGSDRSFAMVKKTIQLNHFSALAISANDIVFKDKAIDHVFAFSVFHYFPSYDYAKTAISEMLRVARKSVCVSDIPTESHDGNHLLFDEDFFEGWQISEGLYPREHRRYTARLDLEV